MVHGDLEPDGFLDTDCAPPVPSDPFFRLEADTVRVYSILAAPIGNALLGLWHKEGALCTSRANRSKFSITAELFVDGALCSLKVRIYQESQPGHHAVEFQRRRGDCLAFSVAYQRARRHLQWTFPMGDQRVASKAARTEEHVAHGVSEVRNASSVGKAIDPLLDMAGLTERPFLQAEAAMALASLAQEGVAVSCLCSRRALEAFVELLRSEHLEVACPTALLLLCLAQRPEAAPRFADPTLLAALLDRVRSAATSPLVQRELARALGAAVAHSALALSPSSAPGKAACALAEAMEALAAEGSPASESSQAARLAPGPGRHRARASASENCWPGLRGSSAACWDGFFGAMRLVAQARRAA
mmetsp:Transcript_65156/g.210074  ORF Transcript_65156/g.210074 Transcript_65156/m.210074 type:complete len:360 (+) Transcript_65156:73-1152(+)